MGAAATRHLAPKSQKRHARRLRRGESQSLEKKFLAQFDASKTGSLMSDFITPPLSYGFEGWAGELMAMGVGMIGLFEIRLPAALTVFNPTSETAGGSFFMGVFYKIRAWPMRRMDLNSRSQSKSSLE